MDYETLEQLCKTVSNELNVANDKIRAAGGKLTQGDVQYLDQLTHMMKSIKTTMAMLDAEKGGPIEDLMIDPTKAGLMIMRVTDM
jgi:hypothetical protein